MLSFMEPHKFTYHCLHIYKSTNPPTRACPLKPIPHSFYLSHLPTRFTIFSTFFFFFSSNGELFFFGTICNQLSFPRPKNYPITMANSSNSIKKATPTKIEPIPRSRIEISFFFFFFFLFPYFIYFSD